MIAICTGVGQDVDLKGGQVALAICAGLHANAHRVARGGGDELLFSGVLQLDGPTRLQRSKNENVLDEHFLLAAEAAAEALAIDAKLLVRQIEYAAQFATCQERRLRRRTEVQATRLVEPGDTAMGLKRGMLHALTCECALVNRKCFGKPRVNIANLVVHFRNDIAGRVCNPACAAVLVVYHRRSSLERKLRIKNGWQDFEDNVDTAASFLGGSFAVRDDRRDALADMTDDVVKHARVIGIRRDVFVSCSREEALWRIFVSQHGSDAGHRKRRRRVDIDNPGVGVRRTKQLDVEQPLNGEIEREACGAGHDLRAGRGRNAAAESFTGRCILGVLSIAERVLNGSIAGAPANVPLQRNAQVAHLRLVQGRTGQDHAGRAEAALECLGLEERSLQRVQLIANPQAFDGRDFVSFGAECRYQTTVDGLAIDQNRACAAIARIAAFLDAEQPEFTQEGPQALACARIVFDRLAVYCKFHVVTGEPNSARISSARYRVICCRHSGLPCTSSWYASSGICRRMASRRLAGVGKS